MSTINEYAIAEGVNAASLTVAVNAKIREGFEPIGNIVFNETKWYQPLFKKQ